MLCIIMLSNCEENMKRGGDARYFHQTHYITHVCDG